jgi:hypothetical protein
MMPYVRITERLHEVNQDAESTSAITNLRCENPNALLATSLANATNLGAIFVMWRQAGRAARAVTLDSEPLSAQRMT